MPLRALLAAALAIILVSCGGHGSDRRELPSQTTTGAVSAAEPARPGIVSPAAQPVTGEWEVGDLRADADPASRRIFYAMRCESDVLTIATTRETIFAELPCTRAIPDEVSRAFLSSSVHIRIVPGVARKLYIDSATAGSFEFTVGSVWIDAR